MKTEIWGTFSVRDHLRERPFVTEVLLYDRLMIPRPPKPEGEGHPGEQDEIGRWHQQDWRPGRLRQLLDILGEADLAIELPWDRQAQQDWHNLYHGTDAEQRGAARDELASAVQEEIEVAKAIAPDQAPYIATGGLIALYIANVQQNDVARRLVALTKTPGVEIEPVIAYSSYGEFQDEHRLQPADPDASPELHPYGLFGWEFFVPEDTDKSDLELLRDAVRLASRSDLRETRQSFHHWLRQMHQGAVDPETTHRHMLQMLNQYQAIIRGSGLKTVARHAAKVVPFLAPLAGFLGPEMGIWGSVAAGGATLVTEWLVPQRKPEQHLRHVAFIHDARRFFGKK